MVRANIRVMEGEAYHRAVNRTVVPLMVAWIIGYGAYSAISGQWEMAWWLALMVASIAFACIAFSGSLAVLGWIVLRTARGRRE